MSDDQQAPVCYRHPDRETWIACSRCGRPICPEDMIPAAVGHQCPTCVHEGAASVRQPRTILGGRIGAPDTAPVTFTLIGMNVVAFLLTGSIGSGSQRSDWYDYALVPGIKHYGTVGVSNGEYYRLVTSMFLHIGLLHLFFNMYALVAVGPALEQILGRWRFIALYFLSGLGGSVAVYLTAAPNSPTAGASGAIFGLFAAFVVVAKKIGMNPTAMLVTIGINLLITFSIPGISKAGHLGGLASGLVLGALFAYVPAGPKRAQVQVAGCVAIGAALAVLTAIGP